METIVLAILVIAAAFLVRLGLEMWLQISINSQSRKWYRSVYERLPTMKFEQGYFGMYEITDPQFQGFGWFFKNNSIQLICNHKTQEYEYIHAEFSKYDPYACYWHWKFRKWLKKNVDLATIPDLRQSTVVLDPNNAG